MASGVTVTGTRDLIANLNRLNVAMKTQIVADAVQAGGGVLRDGMQSRALRFRKTGNLNSKIEVAVSVANGRGEARVGPSRDVFYGGILNQGAKPHVIKPFRSAKTRRSAGGRGRGGGRPRKVLASSTKVYGPIVHHPGFPAHRFMTDTVQQDATRVLAVMAAAVRYGIDHAPAVAWRP